MSASAASKVEPAPQSLGPFEVTGKLGEGGSGVVFAARRDGKALALKVLRSEFALSPREARRFLEEAERMRRVEHPAIVPLLDAGTLDDGRPYLTMPLLEGETLAVRVQRGRLDPPTALRYFADLADAVASIHCAGLIHRDIKPENVILCRDAGRGAERPVLLDLGIARDAASSASTTTEQGNVRGTRAYMAPERFFGAPAVVATDIYELALLLYIMLVGQTPWGAADDASSRLNPRDPVELGVSLDDSLKSTLLRALSTRPEMRPATVTAFAEAVQSVAVVAPPLTDIAPAEKPAPAPALPARRSTSWIAAAIGVSLAIGATVVLTRSSPRGAVTAASAAPPPVLPVAIESAHASGVTTPTASVPSAESMHHAASSSPARARRPSVAPAVRSSAAPAASARRAGPAEEAAPSASGVESSPDRLYKDRK